MNGPDNREGEGGAANDYGAGPRRRKLVLVLGLLAVIAALFAVAHTLQLGAQDARAFSKAGDQEKGEAAEKETETAAGNGGKGKAGNPAEEKAKSKAKPKKDVPKEQRNDAAFEAPEEVKAGRAEQAARKFVENVNGFSTDPARSPEENASA